MVTNSRYNFFVRSKEGIVLYNALTGSLLKLSGSDGEHLVQVLCGDRVGLDLEDLPKILRTKLKSGGFVVSQGKNEVDVIQSRFRIARDDSPMVLTITTTMDCNLGCYYCYEERSQDRLDTSMVSEVVDLAKTKLQRKEKRSLHVDWYGGEPMLNLKFIEEASLALQKLCDELGVQYHASIISNGTLWPDDVGSFVTRHKIRQVQISLDGLRANHNKRRRYRKEFQSGLDDSSFDKAIALIDDLLNYTQVDVRLNFDRKNLGDLEGLMDMVEERGWYDRPYPIVIQPARLSAYTETSEFMRSHELDIDEFEKVRAIIRARAKELVKVEESEIPDGFPWPRTSVCAALAKDSVVVGAESKLYRCGLQVGEQGRSIGSLAGLDSTFYELPIVNNAVSSTSDQAWWDAYDPTTNETCARCSFLPICWGGCPKEHLEQDTHALDEQGRYWRNNLPRLIASRFGSKYAPTAYAMSDQFRSGWD